MPITRHDIKIVVNQNPDLNGLAQNSIMNTIKQGEMNLNTTNKLNVETLDKDNTLDSTIIQLENEFYRQKMANMSCTKNMTEKDWEYLKEQMPKMEVLTNKAYDFNRVLANTNLSNKS
jgi:hypothetical protein